MQRAPPAQFSLLRCLAAEFHGSDLPKSTSAAPVTGITALACSILHSLAKHGMRPAAATLYYAAAATLYYAGHALHCYCHIMPQHRETCTCGVQQPCNPVPHANAVIILQVHQLAGVCAHQQAHGGRGQPSGADEHGAHGFFRILPEQLHLLDVVLYQILRGAGCPCEGLCLAHQHEIAVITAVLSGGCGRCCSSCCLVPESRVTC